VTGGSGRLVLVATPIGNLGDLSPRAVSVLADADVVCCEDTRRTGRLLAHAGVRARRLVVVNEHTEAERTAEVVHALAGGATVAVVTDAGLPGIADPGERLVRAALAAGHEVSVVPGPSAALAALVVSGLPTGRFVVEGFLPRTGSARAARLAEVAGEARTVVLFEAPHRLARTLGDLRDRCGGDRHVVVVRELTKLHEQRWAGTLDEAVARTTAAEPVGEHVLVLAGAPPAPPAGEDAIRDALDAARLAGLSRRDAVADVAARLGVPRNRVYDVATGSGSSP
jgi:16S rRNA (cytidine1402-2'-O)-methyltransferase